MRGGYSIKIVLYQCEGTPRPFPRGKIIAAQKTEATPGTSGANLPFTIVMFCVHRMSLTGLSRPLHLSCLPSPNIGLANWLSGSSVGFRSCPWLLNTRTLEREHSICHTTKVGSLAKVTNKAMLPPLLTAQHFWGQTGIAIPISDAS